MVFFTLSFGLVKNSNAQCGITFTENVVQPTCFGESTGSITLENLTGPNPPFSFMWPMGDTTQNVTNYYSGSYQVYITDSTGCQQMFNIDIPYTSELLVMDSVVNSTGPMMYDGSISLNVTGGTPPYTYNWNNSSQMSVINELISGTYVVTVTDMNACSYIQEYFVDEVNTNICGFIIEPTITETEYAMCNGSIGLFMGGMAKAYGDYTFNWNTGDTTNFVTNLCYAEYTVTITDWNMCSETHSYFINEQAMPCMTVSITPYQTSAVGMNDGSASVYVSGGIAPYKYYWSNGDTLDFADSLYSGAYTLMVYDSDSCVIEKTFSITDNGASCGMTVNTYTYQTLQGQCTGSAEIMVSGGIYPYTYFWSNGDTIFNPDSLCMGEYWVTVYDANMCSQVYNFWINEQECMTVTTYGYDASLAMCNGSADVYASGGLEPYTYLWSSGDTLSHADSLCSGSVWVTVSDANACQVIKNLWINESNIGVCGYTMYPTLYKAEYGMCNGSIQTYISGGMPPFSYEWSDLSTNTTLNNICAGSYSLTVTDMKHLHIQ